MSVMHSSLSRKCFQADPRAQACSMAATLPPQRTCHRRNMQAMHMRYRHQQCPASSKDQWHNRCVKMSLGSTVMQPLSQNTFSHSRLLQARCIDKTDPDKTGKVTQSMSIPCHAAATLPSRAKMHRQDRPRQNW